MLQGATSKVDGKNSVSGLYSFRGRGGNILQGITTFLLSGIGAAAIPARLRLRKNIGERAFTPYALLLSIFFYSYAIYYPFINLIWPDKNEETFFSDLAAVLILLLSVKNIYILALMLVFNSYNFSLLNTLKLGYRHFKRVYFNSGNKLNQYSYFRGEPINSKPHKKIGETFFGYKVDEKIVRVYFEPRDFIIKNFVMGALSMAIVALIVYYIVTESPNDELILNVFVFFFLLLLSFSLKSFALSFSGLCLLIEEVAIIKSIRDNILDMFDGEYDMNFLIKQKEAFSVENIKNESIDIAESIYQNPNPPNFADIPSFNPFPEIDDEDLRKPKKANSRKKDTVAQEKKNIDNLDKFMKKILD